MKRTGVISKGINSDTIPSLAGKLAEVSQTEWYVYLTALSYRACWRPLDRYARITETIWCECSITRYAYLQIHDLLLIKFIAVEWSGYWKENNDAEPEPLANNFSTTYPLKIYRDVSTVLYKFGDLPDPATTNTTDTNATTPMTAENTDGVTYPYTHGESGELFYSQYVFRVDNATAPHVGVIGTHKWDSFDTEISFGPGDPQGSTFKQPLFGYPFDEWEGNIVFVATDHYFESYTNITGVGVFPLAGAVLTENTRQYISIFHLHLHLRLRQSKVMTTTHSNFLTFNLLIVNWRFSVDYNSTCPAYMDSLWDAVQSNTFADYSVGDADFVGYEFFCQLVRYIIIVV